MKHSLCRRTLVTMLMVVSMVLQVTGLAEVQDPKPGEKTPRLKDYDYSDSPLDRLIETVAQLECLQVVFDSSVEESVRIKKVDLKIKNASPMRAILTLLGSQQLRHEYDKGGVLIIFRGTPPDRVILTDVVMRATSLASFVQQLGQYQGVTVALHDSALTRKDQKVNLELRGVSPLYALEVGLAAHRLTYHHEDCDTILIYPDTAVVIP